MHKIPSYIISLFLLFELVLPTFLYGEKNKDKDCFEIFDKALVDKYTPVVNLLPLIQDTSEYDSYFQSVMDVLKELEEYLRNNPLSTQSELSEVSIMFNLLANSLFLPVNTAQASSFMSNSDMHSPTGWSILSAPYHPIYEQSNKDLTKNELLNAIKELPSLVQTKLNSYYNIFRYLSIVSKRLGTIDFNYRKTTDTYTFLDSTLYPYGKYYAQKGEPPFVDDSSMLFNHPHIRWTIYLLDKIKYLKQLENDCILDRWDKTSYLKPILPHLPAKIHSEAGSLNFLYDKFYSKFYSYIFESISLRWDIPMAMILEQLLSYPATVKELAINSTKFKKSEYTFIFRLVNELDSWIKKSQIVRPYLWTKQVKIDKKMWTMFDLIKKDRQDIKTLFTLINKTDLSKYIIKDEGLSSYSTNPRVLDMIIAIYLWTGKDKPVSQPLSVSELKELGSIDFDENVKILELTPQQLQYKFIYDQTRNLSNLNRAYVMWYLAYITKHVINDILIERDNFHEWMKIWSKKEKKFYIYK